MSSESIWTPFDSVTTATVRPIKARLFVAWNRVVGEQDYATVGTSVVGGVDLIPVSYTHLTLPTTPYV